MSKLGNWFGKVLYTLIASQPVDGYVCEGADGKPKVVPLNNIYTQVINNNRQRS